MKYQDGEPCKEHKACQAHLTHPCEGCGRIGARNPIRIQRKRIKGWRMPENTVYVGRGTKWGNPFKVSDVGLERAIEAYKKLMVLKQSPINILRWLNYKVDDGIQRDFWKEIARWLWDYREIVFKSIHLLKGKNLACFCKEGEPCHVDILLELANE